MSAILNQEQKQSNSLSPHVRDRAKHPYLPKTEKNHADKLKRAWVKACKEEAKLRCGEGTVLEALALKYTDPVTGIGRPAQSTIAKELNLTVRGIQKILDRLEEKGVIKIQFIGKQQPNEYGLSGYEYKSSTWGEQSSYNLNNLITLEDNKINNLLEDEYFDFPLTQKKTDPPPAQPINAKNTNEFLSDTRAKQAFERLPQQQQQRHYAKLEKLFEKGSIIESPYCYLLSMIQNDKPTQQEPTMSPTINDPHAARVKAQEIEKLAVMGARERLRQEGRIYPLYGHPLTGDDYTISIYEYNNLEALYTRLEMNRLTEEAKKQPEPYTMQFGKPY